MWEAEEKSVISLHRRKKERVSKLVQGNTRRAGHQVPLMAALMGLRADPDVPPLQTHFP